jgi:hypothetical protein
MKRVLWLALTVGGSLLCLDIDADAQIGGRGGSVNPAGSLGARGRASSVGGLRGRAVNPNFNPPGSISAFQRLNPPGSISPALNLNPQGSIFRPRTGTGSRQPLATAPHAIRRQAYRPPLAPTPAQLELMPRQSLCDWVRSSASQLKGELARFENGSVWITTLQLRRTTEILSVEKCQALTDDDRQRLAATLGRFDKLATESQYDAVTKIPGFTPLQRSLAQLLSADASGGRSPATQQNEVTGVESPRK